MPVRSYGVTADGTKVDLYTLGNTAGLRVQIITYGGTIVGIEVPDRAGERANVILTLPSLAAYMGQDSYLGALIGRFANRIGGASFVLDGIAYQLSKNDGDNCIHGGWVGFNKAVWEVAGWVDGSGPHLTLRHVSPDGDQGFPGTVTVDVTYALSGDNTLRISYRAQTDRATVINLTNHTYFDLGGAACEDILDHELMLAADFFTPVNDRLIPTGQLAAVAGTPFDFLETRRIGARIFERNDQLADGPGYDHNFVLAPSARAEPQFAARVREPRSGRVLEVHTTQPGLQFYSGNHLDGTLRGPLGKVYGRHTALCLEAQHFPDSPNQPGFPSTILRPGKLFTSTTEYRFGID
jgi:aldose 1-epimerase